MHKKLHAIDGSIIDVRLLHIFIPINFSRRSTCNASVWLRYRGANFVNNIHLVCNLLTARWVNSRWWQNDDDTLKWASNRHSRTIVFVFMNWIMVLYTVRVAVCVCVYNTLCLCVRAHLRVNGCCNCFVIRLFTQMVYTAAYSTLYQRIPWLWSINEMMTNRINWGGNVCVLVSEYSNVHSRCNFHITKCETMCICFIFHFSFIFSFIWQFYRKRLITYVGNASRLSVSVGCGGVP